MEYLTGKGQDFYDFLDGITPKDRVAIISHIDLDGIAAAIFLKEILKSKEIEPKFVEFINYGFGMFGKIYDVLKKKRITKIIFSDINESSDTENFEKLRKDFSLFLIDHHPSEIKSQGDILKTRTEDCAGWTIYNLANKLINLDQWKYLVCAAMISDYSYKDEKNLQFIKNIYPDVTSETIFDSEPGKITKDISAGITYFLGKERKVFDLIIKGKIKKLSKYSEEIQKEIQLLVEKYKREAEFYPEKNLYFYYCLPKFNITSTVSTILSVQDPEKTFIFVSDIKNEPDFVKVSSRNQGDNVNLNLLMKKGIAGLENATAGGHTQASAARFLKKDLQKFKENILS